MRRSPGCGPQGKRTGGSRHADSERCGNIGRPRDRNPGRKGKRRVRCRRWGLEFTGSKSGLIFGGRYREERGVAKIGNRPASFDWTLEMSVSHRMSSVGALAGRRAGRHARPGAKMLWRDEREGLGGGEKTHGIFPVPAGPGTPGLPTTAKSYFKRPQRNVGPTENRT